ncbi:protocadherin gamma-A2-like isoform X37 [Solea solea]|uniref:protocadherin gamma-A2-like isoform X37 n=1 Tax=Solea solea TaxID=90069 RepID=UPI00272A96BD|nr:protocadherin gamma-A2-like isoform X37 [Solea solea]
MRRQVLLFLSALCLGYVIGQVSYSIPEEMAKGSVVGNIAHDLGLDLKRIRSGKARVYTGGSAEYIGLNKERGVLLIQERIDREALCGEMTPCALHFQLILENPMELFRVTVEITDINDNAPSFTNADKRFEISESAVIGSKFMLEKAIDSDIGTNGLQQYSLTPVDNFVLKLENQADGNKKAELVLQKPLDREKQNYISLLLTALDGGEPQMSGTMQIFINVLDANDNAPTFAKPLYRAKILENSPKGTSITTVSASDKDIGSNGEVSYLIAPSKRLLNELFKIDSKSGEIILIGGVDYEKANAYQIDIEVIDSGGLSDSTKVIVDVIDINDNNPHINIVSKSESILEDSPPNTVIAMLSISDPDSENNGKVECNIDNDIPFKIQTTLSGFYTLITEIALDRELAARYNITVTCNDEGVPSLSSSVTLTLQISDVNDNAPVFERSSYEAYIVENNTPGLSIFTVKARDADWNQNARVSYILEDSVNGVPVSSYVSVSADSGVIHAVRSFDYEQIKDFHFRVKAQDGGSPPLSSNVTVKILIQDQNDNPPQVLYPVQTGGSVVGEMVPRSADVGYLVSKVVAVDVDSGQNAWLSYKLQKATDRALFEVGLQNGEIRTIRQVTDKDPVNQKLTVIVEDNGQPSRSATVIVNVAVADSFSEVMSEFTDFKQDKEYNDNLTFYLVLALAVVSFLFITCLVVIISVKIYRWRQSRVLYHSNLPVIPYYPPRYSDTLGGTGTLQHVYNYEVCRTTDSRKSDCKFGRAGSQNVLIMDPSSTATMQRIQSEKSILDEPDSPLEQKPPNNDWRFTQGQRPGPSGATGGPEVAMGTGPWPQPPTEAEQLQALMAAANVSEATATLGPGTMGLSTRYSPQFTLQHVPDYRQNVYIPGSTATLTSNPQQQQQQATAQQAAQQALPPPQTSAQPEPPKAAQTPASKKKSTKKEKK